MDLNNVFFSSIKKFDGKKIRRLKLKLLDFKKGAEVEDTLSNFVELRSNIAVVCSALKLQIAQNNVLADSIPG